jgi:glycosyltransferase involved in cell wall biosynthesis
LKKIAFISTNKSSWGGSEYLWYQTALRLSGRGMNVIVSVPRWKEIPDQVGKLKGAGIKTYFNTDTPGYKKLINRVLPSSLQLDSREDGFKFLNTYKPGLTVISQGGNTQGIDLMEFCIRNGHRFVTLSNAANEAKWPADELNKRLSKAFPEAVINFFVSNANIKLTEIQIGQAISNSEIIFNPFNVDFEYDVKYPAIKENYILANVARHEFYAKGQDILFQVMNEKKWRQRNLIVNLYGKGEHSYAIEKLRNYFSLDKVTVAGHVNPNEIWKQCHALILTSRYEGLPLAAVEAMLCGRTGILTGVSGNPEITLDNETGFLAKAATPESVDEALERAWDKREEWEEFGQRAKKYIRTLIPPDPVEHFCNVLEKLNNE